MTNATDRDRQFREDATRILDYHWGEAYKITWDRGTYHAVRRDNEQVISAKSPEALTRLIREDYKANPVPREQMVISDEDEP